MKIIKISYSIKTLFICMTVIGVFFGLIVLRSPIGYRTHSAFRTTAGPKYRTLSMYGYGEDRLGLRANILNYVVLIISPIDAKPVEAGVRRNPQILEVDGYTIELPDDAQLYEYVEGQLKTFRERVTYSQWIEFCAQHSGAFRVEDLLQFVANSETSD